MFMRFLGKYPEKKETLLEKFQKKPLEVVWE